MSKKNHVGIGIQIHTYDELTKLKEEGQSFDGVIRKLIRVYNETVLCLNK